MADRRLRDQERAAAQGDPQAEARLIIERVRAGALPREQVVLAARLGDPVARLAIPTNETDAAVDAVFRRHLDLLDIIIHEIPASALIPVLAEIIAYVNGIWMTLARVKGRGRNKRLMLDEHPISDALRAMIETYVRSPTPAIIYQLETTLLRFIGEDEPGDSALALGSFLACRCLSESRRIPLGFERIGGRQDFQTRCLEIRRVLVSFIELAARKARSRRRPNADAIADELLIHAARKALLSGPHA